ncbi:MAG: F510_1955 family glycosylhydrolase [Pseudomonadota bacterium]
MKRLFPHASAVAALIAVATAAYAAPGEITLTHIHGLAYSADGTELLIPSHHGLAVYRAGRWSKASGPEHDYMGFSATRDRFYSSGHPAPGSGLTNPLGLIRSDDGGKTWSKLGLEGESDFHLLATGYESNAVYVYSTHPNSRIRKPGLYYTVNDGFGWHEVRANGLSGKIAALAVHPADPKTLAVATSTGIYLSRDSGDTFKPLKSGAQAVSVFFDLDGRHLWGGTYEGRGTLARIDLASGRAAPVPVPELPEDAVAYVAQNPKRPSEYAIATFERSVFLSRDEGKSWTPIAERGRAR